MEQGFKKVSKGYGEGHVYVGYGWVIERFEYHILRGWVVYKVEECSFDEEGYVKTPYKITEGIFRAYFIKFAEAKAWCRENAR